MQRAATFTVVAVLALAACSAKRSPAEEIAAARNDLKGRDHGAAIVRLKNALRVDPKSGEARYLLGQALLRSGDPAGAALELRKALDAGQSPDAVVPALATALVDTGQTQRVLTEFADRTVADPDGAAELKSALAAAYLAGGQTGKAAALLADIEKAVPGHARATLLRARVEVVAGRRDAALESLDALLKAHPDMAAAWLLQAQLLSLGQADDAPRAAAAYRKALALEPRMVGAHVGLVTLLMQRHDTEKANEQFAAMRKALPQNPATHYIAAMMALSHDKTDEARAEVQQVLKVAPDHPDALQLSAEVELRGGNLLQAQAALVKALQADDTRVSTRKLLAQVQLRMGRAAKTLDSLQPLLRSAAPDAEAYALAGEAHLVLGNGRAAQEAFAHSVKLDPQNTRSRTALALVKLGKGDTAAGLSDLQAISRDGSETAPDFALITADVELRRYDEALAAIDALARKLPGRAVVSLLRGRVELLRNDRTAARAAFERALKDEPAYVPAAEALAALDLEAGDAAAARQRYERILAADRRNMQALTAIAGLAQRTGASKSEVADMLSEAIKLNPTEVAPRVDLVKFLLAAKSRKAALDVAQEAVAAFPAHPEALDVLGSAQLENGDFNQALASFNKLAQVMPDSAHPYLRMASLHSALRESGKAVEDLRRAVAMQPGLVTTQRQLVKTLVDARRSDEARAVATDMKKRFPDRVDGWLAEGGIEAQLKNWGRAVEAYRIAHSRAPGTETALRLHGALVNVGRGGEASELAESWIKKNPQDAGFLFYLGDLALGRRDFGSAERYYRGVVAAQPENVLALNNLAWTLAETKKPGAADVARQGLKLAPESSALLDTLAVALEGEGKPVEAEDARRRAVKLAPGNVPMRLELAKAYIRNGKKTEARAELEALTKDGHQRAYPVIAELARGL